MASIALIGIWVLLISHHLGIISIPGGIVCGIILVFWSVMDAINLRRK